ncbi:cathepsin D [Ranunculus cassubicifolius]
MKTLVVYLLLIAIILTKESSIMAITFSSKLIHRFSDEVKAFRVSRNEEISSSDWPKRKSMEYYNLLVSSDLERQKLKLGGKNDFVFPSKGSDAISLGNDGGWLHYTWIDIGTPNVSYLVALDSGSDLLWLPCECIECAPLSASYYSNLDRDLSAYSPAESSSSKHLYCSHELCELGPNCKNPMQPCPYIRKYYSENTSSSGYLVEDTLHLATNNDHGSKSLLHAPVIIGCGRKQSGAYLNDRIAPNGLMGLGLGDVSVPSILANAGLMKNSFSMCFSDDDSGRIFFGDQGTTTQKSTPFLPLKEKNMYYMVEVEGVCIGSNCLKQSGFRAQVDSGSSFTFLPDEMYEKVVAQVDRRVNATRANYEDSPWEYCYETSSYELLKLPLMTLLFSLNNSFVVHDPFFVINENEGVTVFCLAIQSIDADFGFIGQNFMTSYRMVFDRENSKLHWSHSSCNDFGAPSPKPENPLPTNEQQTPHGQAVAPAVAGRTPSNPSAAAFHGNAKFCMLKLLQLLLLLFLLVS